MDADHAPVPPSAAETRRRKRLAARAALPYVEGEALIGVGHGSTVAAFIEELAHSGRVLKAVVAASEASSRALRSHGIAVVPLEEVRTLPVYVDGCDEADRRLRLLKGAGGALTREKLAAMRAERFVCVADDGKLADRLGGRPVVVEVFEPAVEVVAEELRRLGGSPVRRPASPETPNPLLDVSGLDVADDPLGLERRIDAMPGVVECGIFAARPADVLLLGTAEGVRTLVAE